MGKVKLGEDFTDESVEVETTQEEEKEDSTQEEEEKDNSADASDSKNHDDEESEESEEDSEDTSDEEDEDDEDVDLEAKKRELQGLKDAESELDKDLEEIEEEIQKTRKRIVAKRQARRDHRQVVQHIDNVEPDEEQDDLSDIDEETQNAIERVIRAKGYVRKEDVSQMSYKSAHQMAEEKFFQEHPEYSVESDDGDVLFDLLSKELQNFSRPKDPSQIPALFERAHLLVKTQNPEYFKDSKKSPEKIEKIAKKSARIKKAGTGGGTSGGSTTSSKKSKDSGGKGALTESQKEILRRGGWTDEEIAEM